MARSAWPVARRGDGPTRQLDDARDRPANEIEPRPLARITARATYAGTTTGPVPKSPADRLPALRRLAEGEDCSVRYMPVCRRDVRYTVWAHTNTLADQKGGAYKGHDSAGMFACDQCHEVVDRRLLPPQEIDALVARGQERTRIRLREISTTSTMKPWRVRAARWALSQLEARAYNGETK
jgi:hypothetical protein